MPLRLTRARRAGGEFPLGVVIRPGQESLADPLRWKRAFDLVLSAVGLFFLSPLMSVIALIIKVADRGPVFYRQTRVGQFGVPFGILKFRTMVPDADKQGPAVTRTGDPRITAVGRILRRSKLDELPQLFNVLKGEMSLVGPRPEVLRYVEHYTPEQRQILRYKPGITDLASLCFREEELLLRGFENTELFYLTQCLPRKLELNQQYARTANLLTDTWIIVQTVCPFWVGVLGLYALVLGLALWLTGVLTSNLDVNDEGALVRQSPVVVGAQLAMLLRRRQCTGLLCYFGLPELKQLARGLVQAAVLLAALSLIAGGWLLPINRVVIDFCLAFLMLGGLRFWLRQWRQRAQGETGAPERPLLRVGIIGAGSLGAHLAHYLNTQKNLGREAIVFFDDDSGKWRKRIHDVPVAGMPECVLQGWSDKLDEVAIAMPDASLARLEQIRQLFANTPLRVYTIQWPVPVFVEPRCRAAG